MKQPGVLEKVLKAVNCESVKLEYSEKMPLRMELQVCPDPEAKLHFYLAQRVQE